MKGFDDVNSILKWLNFNVVSWFKGCYWSV